MGILNFEYAREHKKRIIKVLADRGLVPDFDNIWEIHGPHPPNMNYQVYVGQAYYKNDKKQDLIEVAIYPKAVYYIDLEQWHIKCSENRITKLKYIK